MARRHSIVLGVIGIVAVMAAGLRAMGRPAICRCGRVELWHGRLDAGNSQHLLDWYSLSHVVHGLIFYGLGRLLLPRWAPRHRLLLAAAVEAAWESIENSPAVIDRYRAATIALGYSGDSIVNSLADVGCMVLGFALAWRLPVAASILLALALELTALAAIRDNLTLNVVMLLWPIEAVRVWQGQ